MLITINENVSKLLASQNSTSVYLVTLTLRCDNKFSKTSQKHTYVYLMCVFFLNGVKSITAVNHKRFARVIYD